MLSWFQFVLSPCIMDQSVVYSPCLYYLLRCNLSFELIFFSVFTMCYGLVSSLYIQFHLVSVFIVFPLCKMQLLFLCLLSVFCMLSMGHCPCSSLSSCYSIFWTYALFGPCQNSFPLQTVLLLHNPCFCLLIIT